MKTLRLLTNLSALLCFAGAAQLYSTEMVSNLANADRGLINSSCDVTNVQKQADAFTTGATASFLNSITIKTAVGTGTGFSLALYSDNASLPGTLIETLSGSVSPTTASAFTYTASGLTTLNANTTYFWVAAGSVSGDNFVLQFTADATQSSPAAWTISDNFASSYDGTNWTPRSGGNTPQFAINATAVPEPSTYAAIAGVAALGFVAYRRRQARA